MVNFWPQLRPFHRHINNINCDPDLKFPLWSDTKFSWIQASNSASLYMPTFKEAKKTHSSFGTTKFHSLKAQRMRAQNITFLIHYQKAYMAHPQKYVQLHVALAVPVTKTQNLNLCLITSLCLAKSFLSKTKNIWLAINQHQLNVLKRAPPTDTPVLNQQKKPTKISLPTSDPDSPPSTSCIDDASSFFLLKIEKRGNGKLRYGKFNHVCGWRTKKIRTISVASKLRTIKA